MVDENALDVFFGNDYIMTAWRSACDHPVSRKGRPSAIWIERLFPCPGRSVRAQPKGPAEGYPISMLIIYMRLGGLAPLTLPTVWIHIFVRTDVGVGSFRLILCLPHCRLIILILTEHDYSIRTISVRLVSAQHQ